jgi:F0F1-type ATP synthase delta subunit
VVISARDQWVFTSIFMKLSPKTYAQILIAKAGDDKHALASKFWFSLQKNNQYKDLPKVVAELDKEYARENNSVFVEIVSENKLSDGEISQIESKLVQLLDKKIISKNIVKENFGPGIVVKTDEMEIDVSALGKVEGLKRQFNNQTS